MLVSGYCTDGNIRRRSGISLVMLAAITNRRDYTPPPRICGTHIGVVDLICDTVNSSDASFR